MPPRVTDHPTSAEMEILQALWKLERGTVRDIQVELNRLRPTGYTTALKLLQTMHAKRLVARETQGKAHVYWAVKAEHEVRSRVLHSLIDRVFGGSVSSLVLHAVEHEKLNAKDLEAVRRVLEGDEAKRPRPLKRGAGKVART